MLPFGEARRTKSEPKVTDLDMGDEAGHACPHTINVFSIY
jgi:hypothetical protein